jgi:hypothetical protein
VVSRDIRYEIRRVSVANKATSDVKFVGFH